MNEPTKSLIDQAITACHETLETIKRQQEFNKFLLNTHKCPTCGKTFTDKDNADCIDDIGVCIQCDHVQGDVNFKNFIDYEKYSGEGIDFDEEGGDK